MNELKIRRIINCTHNIENFHSDKYKYLNFPIGKWRQNIDMMDEKNYDKLWKFILKFTDFVEESVSAGTERLLLIPNQIESFTVQERIFWSIVWQELTGRKAF